MIRIGAHDRHNDPLALAPETGVDVVQFFLGDPQGWGAPVIPGGDPAALREAFAQADVDVYIHAPYVINVASANNRIRIPSRKLLAQQLQAAAAVGAKGLIVHGGHVTKDVAPATGHDNWRKAIERMPRPVPLLIENTAGGEHAMARGLDAVAGLWDAIADLTGPAAEGGGHIGFCLDTCHFHASGDDLSGLAGKVAAITGRIDLVHCNNSRDGFGSGRDRHAGLESGTIDPDLIVDLVRAANAPVVCETPDPAVDARRLRERLSAG